MPGTQPSAPLATSKASKVTDGMLDSISGLQRRIDNGIEIIEEAMLARPGDPLLDQLWLTLK